MVTVRYQGEIGEWLFQYALARVVAERFGKRLEALPIPGFPGTGVSVVGKREFGAPVPVYGFSPTNMETFATAISIEEIGEWCESRPLLFCGWFQDCKLISDRLKEMRESWFKPEFRLGGGLKSGGRLVACFRAYQSTSNSLLKRNCKFPDANTLLDIARQRGLKKVLLITDFCTPFVSHNYSDRRIEILESHGLARLQILVNSEHLYIQEDSTDWWGALISGSDSVTIEIASRKSVTGFEEQEAENYTDFELPGWEVFTKLVE